MTSEEAKKRFETIEITEIFHEDDEEAQNLEIQACKEQQPSDDILDKIRAEILDEAEYAYADFDEYKEMVLYAEPDELPNDDFRYGMERAVEIINKYRNKYRKGGME